MREKRPALVITFPTTAAAMGCESLCIERGLPGRTIPVPGEVAAGCGTGARDIPAILRNFRFYEYDMDHFAAPSFLPP